MVSDGPTGERRRPRCTWGYKGALGPGQVTNLWPASSDLNASVSLSQEEVERTDRPETYGIIIQNVVARLFCSRV